MEEFMTIAITSKKYIRTLAAWFFAVGVCLLIYAYARSQAPAKVAPKDKVVSPARETVGSGN
jgi:hypothetical protein